VHVPSEEKGDYSKDSFYEEFEHAFFHHFPKYRTKILLGDLKQKWGERIFSNRQLGMGAHIGMLVIMVLE